jgi:phage terminase large subunit-like protein
MWGRLGKQLPPDEQDWRSWLILGGRGAGKTRAGAEWVKAQALGDWTQDQSHAERIAIIGPTLEQARAVMIEGKSGLLSIHMEGERPHYEPSKRLITWPTAP